jgi:hypothetical protein
MIARIVGAVAMLWVGAVCVCVAFADTFIYIHGSLRRH